MTGPPYSRYFVKYAPALVIGQAASGDPPADGLVSAAALVVITLPTALNAAKWAQRSKEDAEFIGDF